MREVSPESNEYSVEDEEAEEPRRSWWRRALNWFFWVLLLLFLLALLWPINKEEKKRRRELPPKFSVSTVSRVPIKEGELKEIGLERNYRGYYLLLGFVLRNDEGEIPALTYDNFQLVIKQGKLKKEILPLEATEELYTEKETPWGRSLRPGQPIKLKLVFFIPHEASVEGFRVYDASWRSSRFKDFPLLIPANTTQSPDALHM